MSRSLTATEFSFDPTENELPSSRPRSPGPALDWQRLRAEFPLLEQRVHGRPLTYLDNAASTQKPRAVLDALSRFYTHSNANVHRGAHALSEAATAGYEGARETVRAFLGARSAQEIVFTRGTTEAINLVAQSWGRRFVSRGDAVLVSGLEHHSNLVPWQLLCQEKPAELRILPVTSSGELDLDRFPGLVQDGRVRLLSVTHVSNALGTRVPLERLIPECRERGIAVLVDGAQAAPHLPLCVTELGCDFYAWSGHKVYGPTGIGVLYGRLERLEEMPPWQGGGEMIREVTYAGSTYAPPPHRFEAGTPPIADAIGLAAAVRFLETLDRTALAAHEAALVGAAAGGLERLPGVRVIGAPAERVGLISFVVEGIHPHDLATVLDRAGIAIRAGHHCAQPLLRALGLTATARASFALYNTPAEVEALLSAVEEARRFFLPT